MAKCRYRMAWKGKRELRIAMPCFGEEVAPSFEAALHFRLWHCIGNEIIKYQEVESAGKVDGLSRARFLISLKVNVLLCNGIRYTTRKILIANGCKVIQSIAGPASDALFDYLSGKMIHNGLESHLQPGPSQPQTSDLTQWIRELFKSLHWKIHTNSESKAFPVDLVAEKNCPICHRTVRVAICCGAHAYRVDEEIREFHRVTASGFHCRVYVHQFLPGVAKKCIEYGILLLDPITFSSSCNDEKPESLMPPLKGQVYGHPRLNTPVNPDFENA